MLPPSEFSIGKIALSASHLSTAFKSGQDYQRSYKNGKQRIARYKRKKNFEHMLVSNFNTAYYNYQHINILSSTKEKENT